MNLNLKNMNFKTLFSLLAFFAGTSISIAQVQPGYFMDPDLKGDQIVFVAEGDIWRVSVTGGDAIRLTSHQGNESSPKISPDG